jgi:hypothetical protein
MRVLKIVSIVSKYQRWIKNCLAFLPSEFLIDNPIINATKISRCQDCLAFGEGIVITI